ncbi:MAG TPA: septum formation initiator family protein [Gaiellaceae bacterium]
MRIRPTRLLAIGALALVGFLYWKPINTYLQTKRELDGRRAQVQELRDEQRRLQKKIATANTTPALIRQARLLGLVKPGEQLFIVRGISTWRHRNNK